MAQPAVPPPEPPRVITYLYLAESHQRVGRAFSVYGRNLRRSDPDGGADARIKRLRDELDLFGLYDGDGRALPGRARLWYEAQLPADRETGGPEAGRELRAFLAWLYSVGPILHEDRELPDVFWLDPAGFCGLCDAAIRVGRTLYGLSPAARVALYTAALATALPAVTLARVTPEDCDVGYAVRICGVELPRWAGPAVRAIARGTQPGQRLWRGDWTPRWKADAMLLCDYLRGDDPRRPPEALARRVEEPVTPDGIWRLDAPQRSITPARVAPSFDSLLTTRVLLLGRSKQQLAKPQPFKGVHTRPPLFEDAFVPA